MTNSLDVNEWQVAINNLIYGATRTVAAPYNRFPGDRPGLQSAAKLNTRELWDAYQWNPPQYLTEQYPDPDPDASPKPAWDDIVEAHRRQRLAFLIHRIDTEDRPRVRELRETVGDTHIVIDGKNLHVGQGISHMPGLALLLEQATHAGGRLPYAVIRRPNGTIAKIHLQRDMRTLLEAVADRENRIESAHNPIIADYERSRARAGDESLSLQEREDAASTAAAIALGYSRSLESALANYDPDALPDDLPTLKELYSERIEAAAMKRVKEIKGAKTQQGVDVPATCLDMANALEQVAQECALGVAAVNDVEGIDDAKAAFAAAVATIEAVTPLNVPEWASDQQTITGHQVTVRANHPAGEAIPGRVTLTLWGVTDGNGGPLSLAASVTRPGGGAAVVWQAQIPIGTVYPVEASFAARNLCGPSRFDLTIEDPSA